MVIDNGRPRTLVRGGSLVTDIGGWEVVVWLISFGWSEKYFITSESLNHFLLNQTQPNFKRIKFSTIPNFTPNNSRTTIPYIFYKYLMWLIVSGREKVMSTWDSEIITHKLQHRIVVRKGVLKFVLKFVVLK